MQNLVPSCIYCEQSEFSVPLLHFQYKGIQYWICPEHLPILIHQPNKFAAKLPGLQDLTPSGEGS